MKRLFSLSLLCALCFHTVLWSAVTEVRSIDLTVRSLETESRFFTEVLGFRPTETREESGPELDRMLGLAGARVRIETLCLGDESIRLIQFLEPSGGRAIPSDSRSFDHWFQHIAIVVRDMDAAYAVLAKHRVKHVSTAPQTLPQWNAGAAGIKAFYFQDPEGHVLEIIWFPKGKGDPKWQQPRPDGELFLGIDHTAIVVSDTERSLDFYRAALGLRVAGASENYGLEQEHLNQTFGARLRITALRAPKGPGIEFLEYIAPPGGRTLPADARANDLWTWRVVLPAEAAAASANDAVKHGGSILSLAPVNAPSRLLVRDPDGHVMQLENQ